MSNKIWWDLILLTQVTKQLIYNLQTNSLTNGQVILCTNHFMDKSIH